MVSSEGADGDGARASVQALESRRWVTAPGKPDTCTRDAECGAYEHCDLGTGRSSMSLLDPSWRARRAAAALSPAQRCASIPDGATTRDGGTPPPARQLDAAHTGVRFPGIAYAGGRVALTWARTVSGAGSQHVLALLSCEE